jgi:CBS domain containing-hemolysin-like protein
MTIKGTGGNEIQKIYFQLGGQYLTLLNSKKQSGKEYMLYVITLQNIKTRFNEQALNALSSGSCTIVLDACMVLRVNGKNKGGMNDNGPSWGKVYTTYAGISKAANWTDSALSALYSYYGKTVRGLFHTIDVMTEEELRTIVDVGQEDGIIEDEERDMIHNVFDFGDAEAKEVMVPRIDMTFVHVDATYDELISIFREDKFTRLPVYDESTDNVIGIVNMKDLLLLKDEDKEHFSIRNIMREPYFTYEHKNTANLFLEMRESSISLAIVLDEYGVTAGLITLEDLLEEIVGEIRDEYDSDEQDDITRINDYEYIVLGSANLEDVSDELGLHLESDDYDTIGGYCLEKLDHLPEKNEIIITDDNILLRIEAVDKNRIEKVYIKLPKPSEEEN